MSTRQLQLLAGNLLLCLMHHYVNVVHMMTPGISAFCSTDEPQGVMRASFSSAQGATCSACCLFRVSEFLKYSQGGERNRPKLLALRAKCWEIRSKKVGRFVCERTVCGLSSAHRERRSAHAREEGRRSAEAVRVKGNGSVKEERGKRKDVSTRWNACDREGKQRKI